MDDVWMSVGWGAGIGLLYAVASLATARLAARFGDRQFMLIFMGGMMARLAVAVVLVMLVLVLVDVHRLAFISTLLFVFLVGLAIEIWVVHRHRAAHGPAEAP